MAKSQISNRPKYPRVAVRTWGTTKDTSASGMLHYYDTNLFGGNVGHASIALELPLSYKETVLQYCYNELDEEKIIPFEERIDHETGEKYIEVYFSWWPGVEYNGCYLEPNIENDRLNERRGSDISYSNSENLETVFVKGNLGHKKIHLSNLSTITTSNPEIPAVKELLVLITQYEKTIMDLEELETLINLFNPNQLQTTDDKLTISIAKRSHLKRLLSGLLPEQILDKNHLNKQDLENIKNIGENKIEKLKKDRDIMYSHIVSMSEAIGMKLSDIDDVKKLQERKELIKKLLENPNEIKNEYALDYATNEEKLVLEQELNDENKHTITNLKSMILLKEKIHIEEKLKRYELVYNYLESIIENGYYNGLKENSCTILSAAQDAMDITAMLKEMRAISDDGKFHLKYNNCSLTVGKILAAGAPNTRYRKMANRKGWGFFGNPQLIYNAAKYIEKDINSENNFFDWLTACDFLKINKLTGFIIGSYIKAMKKDEAYFADKGISAKASHKKLTLNKLSAILKSLPLVPVIGFLYIIKHLMMPSLFIKDCASLLKWVFKNSYLPFKIIFPIVIIPAMAVHLIPAALEIIIKAIAKGCVKAKKSIKQRSSSKFNTDQEPENEINLSSDTLSDVKELDTKMSDLEDEQDTDVSDSLQLASDSSSHSRNTNNSMLTRQALDFDKRRGHSVDNLFSYRMSLLGSTDSTSPVDSIHEQAISDVASPN